MQGRPLTEACRSFRSTFGLLRISVLNAPTSVEIQRVSDSLQIDGHSNSRSE